VMQAFYLSSEKKSNIVEVIGQRVELRKSGRELVGLCPFHDDRHPSLYVNSEKGVFLCRACQAGGDAIGFVRLIEGCSFKEALSILGLAPGPRAVPTTRRRRAAERVVRWVSRQRARLNNRIRELDEQIELADEIPDPELAEGFWRERGIIADLRDDLSRMEYLPNFIELKQSIEGIGQGKL